MLGGNDKIKIKQKMLQEMMNQIEIINSMTADNIDNIKRKETQLESSLDIEKEKQESKRLTQMLYN